MAKTDFAQLSRELIRQIRGSTSQSALSRRLGFAGKHVHRLENGERGITWDTFVKVCGLCQVDVDRALRMGLRIDCASEDDSILLDRIVGSAKLNRLQTEIGVSRFSLMRWKSGSARVPLPAILQLIDHCQFQLFEFIEQLCDPEEIPSIRHRYVERQRKKALYFRYPQIAAVIVCLQLDEYRALRRHRDGYIAEKLGLDLPMEQLILRSLVDVKRIRKKAGKYVPEPDAVDLGGASVEDIRHFSMHWLGKLEKAMSEDQFWQNERRKTRFGMEIFAVNAHTKEYIAEEFRAFQQRVRARLTQETLRGGSTDQVAVVHTIFYDPLELV